MRPTGDRRWPAPRALRGLASVVATLVVALIVGSAGLPRSPSPTVAGRSTTPSTPAAPASPGVAPGSAAPSPTPSPAPDGGTWSPVWSTGAPAVAELTATVSSAAGVAGDTAFVLHALGGANAVELARGVSVTPPLDLRTEPGPDPSVVTLRPAQPLEPGSTHRFELRRADGSLAGSWAFQAQQAPRVVTTLPADGATNVPTDTGIELTFDQDGVGDPAPFFSIEPAVDGHVERHDRTFVFAPAHLAERTVYTVTLRHGVPLTGTDLAMEQDVRLQFETGAGGATPPSNPELNLGRTVAESSPRQVPVLGASIWVPKDATVPASLAVTVHRLPTIDAALAALAQLRAAPDWAQWRSTPVVGTTGLARTTAFRVATGPLADGSGGTIRFPARLATGWYLVTCTGVGPPEQAILQVTDVATYAVESVTRTIVWVNDLVTGRPVPGAEVALAGATVLGRTGPDGLLDAATPAAVLASARPEWSWTPASPPVVVVTAPDGRQVLLPFATHVDPNQYPGYVFEGYWHPADQYWRLLYTDRTLYRSDDEVNAWGLVRDRDSGSVPAGAELRLRNAAAWDPEAPPVASVALQPDDAGSFAVTLPLRDVPLGSYILDLWAGGLQLASAWIQVGVIGKPAYQLEVTTDHRAYISGDAVRVGIQATFYDGTPVPDVALDVAAFGTRHVTADGAGRASVTARAPAPEEPWEPWIGSTHWTNESVSAVPARAEEGEISGDTGILVFPAAVYLDGETSYAAGRITVQGTLHAVDLAAVERQLDADANAVDPRGRAVTGASVTVRVAEQIPVQRLVGQHYDPIEKRVVNDYEYDTEERDVAVRTLTTGADGGFRLSVTAPSTERDYRIYLATRDTQGRTERVVGWVSPSSGQPAAAPYPVLEADASCTWINTHYHLGQAMNLTMRDRGVAMPAGGQNRYLFVAAQRGVRRVLVQSSPTFVSDFEPADAPSLSVLGVRFTGAGYVPARNVYRAALDTSDRQLTIALSADRAVFRPGESVTLDVRTTGPAGFPIAATVTLRAVDQRLFDVGGAAEADPLADLYTGVDDGILYDYATHAVPAAPGYGGCGGAGGVRQDFRDTLLFRQIRTDAAGHARVTFGLSDDLTSWHVSASGIGAGLEAGEASILVPVGLPFFVQPTLGAEYLSGDRVVLGLRAYGSALKAGQAVTFTVASASLAMPTVTLSGRAFEAATVPLPALSAGTFELTISATASGTGTTLSDRLLRTFRVVDSRLTRTETAYSLLSTGSPPATGTPSPPGAPSGGGPITYTFADAGRGRYVPLLESLAWSGGARLDQSLAQAWARRILVDSFGRDPASLPAVTFDPTRYQQGGAVALLPYASPDSTLAVQLALLAPGWFDADGLRAALASAFGTSDTTQRTREQNAMVLAGQAALGGATPAEVRSAAAQPGLTIRERLYLALAAESVGDDPTARAIEQDLLATAGETMGPWVRLRVGTTGDDTLQATALLALVAAGLGDPLATQAEAYVQATPSTDQLFVLQELAVVERALDRTPSAAASFAYTVAGVRHVVDLRPCEARMLVLTADQRATLVLEPLTGQVGVATSWQVPLVPAVSSADPALRLTRSIERVGATGSLYQVTLQATFGAQALAGPYVVTDLLPSALAPATRFATWQAAEGEAAAPGASPAPTASAGPAETVVTWPCGVEGQRVRFVVAPTSEHRTVTMRYLARAVTGGDYAWEPAVLQSVAAAQSMAFTPPGVRFAT